LAYVHFPHPVKSFLRLRQQRERGQRGHQHHDNSYTHPRLLYSLKPSNSTELRYLSPESGRMTTKVLPFISASRAIPVAAAPAAPQEIPERIPSPRDSRRAIVIDPSSLPHSPRSRILDPGGS